MTTENQVFTVKITSTNYTLIYIDSIGGISMDKRSLSLGRDIRGRKRVVSI